MLTPEDHEWLYAYKKDTIDFHWLWEVQQSAIVDKWVKYFADEVSGNSWVSQVILNEALCTAKKNKRFPCNAQTQQKLLKHVARKLFIERPLNGVDKFEDSYPEWFLSSTNKYQNSVVNGLIANDDFCNNVLKLIEKRLPIIK